MEYNEHGNAAAPGAPRSVMSWRPAGWHPGNHCGKQTEARPATEHSGSRAGPSCPGAPPPIGAGGGSPQAPGPSLSLPSLFPQQTEALAISPPPSPPVYPSEAFTAMSFLHIKSILAHASQRLQKNYDRRNVRQNQVSEGGMEDLAPSCTWGGQGLTGTVFNYRGGCIAVC